MLVIPLKEAHKDAIAIVGGKGANLGEMANSGFPIPQGFCITSSAYDTYIRENRFTEDIAETLLSLDAAPELSAKLAAKLMDRIKTGKISSELHAAIQRAYGNMGAKTRVAVRSSATAEDLPEASFAGQQETYLNIQGIDAVIHAVQRCFASLWTERAIAYRRETGFDNQKLSLAVVVQEMIESDRSGVLFTVNPLNQETGEMMINASYGLGEAIVSGLVTPDTYIWDKAKGAVKQKTLGSKDVAVVYDSGGGTAQRPNDPKAKSRYCLSGKQLRLLTALALKIEAHYGAPQDIEWAFNGNRLFILQARGITTLRQMKPSPSVKIGKKQNKRERMMMNNLLEHCPTPLYPLDYAPFCAVAQGKAITIQELGIKMTGDTVVLKDTGELEIQTPTIKATPRALLLPFRLKAYRHFARNMACTEEVFQKVRPSLDEIEASDPDSLSTGALLQQLRQVMDYAESIIYVRFRYNIYPSFIANRSIRARLKRLSPPVSPYDMLSGLHYKTWDMNMAITELAEQVNRDAALREAIILLPDDHMNAQRLAQLAAQFPSFGSLYTQIIEEYGWKSTSTYLAFSSSSWKEDKRNFLTLLRVAMTRPAALADSDKYDTICRQITTAYSRQKAKKILTTIEQLRSYHQNREESLYLLERCYGLGRMAVKEIAKRYPQLFPSDTDILYLILNEVYMLEASGPSEALTQAIMLRKQAAIKNRALWEEMENQAPSNAKGLLTGISGNGGKVKGRVCLIHDLSEFDKLKQGEILVCKYTDPVWTPLFTIAQAVVSDTGGPLSHSAIVAREYNIPAVLGCGNATKVLSDGQEIIVNGDEGIIQIIS